MKKIRFNKWTAIAAFPMLMKMADSAQASVIFYLNDTVNNKIIVPGTTSTWASVKIDDRGSAGFDGVSMEFYISKNLISSQDTINTFISSWYFNYNSKKTIVYDYMISDPNQYKSTPTIQITQNGIDSPIPFSGSPQNFDLGIDFGNKGGTKGQFGVGDTVTLYFTGNIESTDFLYYNNTPARDGEPEGKYYTIAEVQGFTVNGKSSSSTYTTIPELSAGALSMMTATICCVFARKRRDLQV